MKNIGVIVQARLGSARLPNKILNKIGDLSILEFQLKKFSEIGIPVVIATTDKLNDDILAYFLDRRGILYYRGNEENVLKRYIDTAESFNFDKIIRICSDNPFIDIPFLKRLLNIAHENTEKDYISFSFQNKPTILSHFGIFAEYVTLNALKKVESYENRFYNEHVTYGIYSNPDAFNIMLIPLDNEIAKFNGIRLTVDDQKDYENTLAVHEIIQNEHIERFEDLAEIIISNQTLFERMKTQIERNTK